MSFNPFSLQDKVILITGASSGIGRQCAIDCSRMGARIALVGRNNKRLNETLAQMENKEEHLISIIDLADIKKINEVVSGVVASLGKINGLVYAAGIEKTLPLQLTKENDMEEVFKVNVNSAVEIVKIISKNKNRGIAQKHVLISSISGVIGRSGLTAYSASKGALISLTRSLAVELAIKKININCVSPGTILTPMMQKFLSELSEEQKAKRVEGFLLGLGRTTDVSNICIFLLSDAARWITGQNMIVDGGYTAR